MVNVNSKRSFIKAGKKLIAAVGVRDLVVVDTDNALLVCSKENTQDVKKLVNLLEEKGYGKIL